MRKAKKERKVRNAIKEGKVKTVREVGKKD